MVYDKQNKKTRRLKRLKQENKKTRKRKNGNMRCETCAFYVYDEEYDDYCCTAYMDEDDYARFMQGYYKECPLWRDGDEYVTVRHQM